MGGEVIELAGLEAEGFRKEADLELGGSFRLLPQEAENAAPVERSHVADDGSVLREFGDLPRVSQGVVQIAGGIDQF